jgi:hypothetical protein
MCCYIVFVKLMVVIFRKDKLLAIHWLNKLFYTLYCLYNFTKIIYHFQLNDKNIGDINYTLFFIYFEIRQFVVHNNGIQWDRTTYKQSIWITRTFFFFLFTCLLETV